MLCVAIVGKRLVDEIKSRNSRYEDKVFVKKIEFYIMFCFLSNIVTQNDLLNVFKHYVFLLFTMQSVN